MDKRYHVHILTNVGNTVLYTGVTNDLPRRLAQHKEGVPGSFTKRYNVTKLVHYETFGDIRDAISREKQIKGGSRRGKLDLINQSNPSWRDLSEEI